MIGRLRLLAFVSITLAAGPLFAQGEESTEGEEIRAASVSETSVSEGTAGDETEAVANSDGAESDGRSPIDGVMGHVGLGYFTSSSDAPAPVGMRYWFSRDSGFDIGIDAAYSSGDIGGQRYGLELGYVMALSHYHYSVVFARIGTGLRYLSTSGDHATKPRYDLNASTFVGAELFLGAFGFPNVSLQGGYGVEANYTYDGGPAFLIGTASGGLSVVGAGTLGFHIYL